MLRSRVVENHHEAGFQPLRPPLPILLILMYVSAFAAEPVRYIVRFPAPQTHYVEVEAQIPVSQKPQVELFMPVWTPGSYLIREYARNVEALTATDLKGTPLQVLKTRKNRWRIITIHPLDRISVRYRVYCHELSVRTNWVDDQFALLNGAATFLTLTGGVARVHEVKLELPSSWAVSLSGLPSDPSGNFAAADYDSLVDSPIVAGNPSVYEFQVDGKSHLLVNVGEAGLWDGRKAVRDIEKVVRQYRAMWGSLPYDKYVFFNLLTGAGGGVEHRNSVVMMSDRFAMRTHPAYVGWLDLASHEYFHLWNVKRLRPMELGPFDYENEVYTRNLWISEGFTDYYGPLTVHRAGLSTEQELLGNNRAREQQRSEGTSLSSLIEKLQTTPGRLQQPASVASFDAWIKLYRPDENSPNSSISYYTKGAVIGWLLDAKVRRATNNSRSLDDVMRLAFERYSGTRGFSDDDFRSTAQEIAGINLKDWFHNVVDTTAELDYSEALSWFGLRFRPVLAAESTNNDHVKKSWLGFTTKNESGRLMITQVPRGTPAYAAGISPGDEILGIDNYRVRPEQWEQRMEQYYPDTRISLLVSRSDRLITIPVLLGEEPGHRWILERDPNATQDQQQHLKSWLSPLI